MLTALSRISTTVQTCDSPCRSATILRKSHSSRASLQVFRQIATRKSFASFSGPIRWNRFLLQCTIARASDLSDLTVIVGCGCKL
jgi:hypothetical protein